MRGDQASGASGATDAAEAPAGEHHHHAQPRTNGSRKALSAALWVIALALVAIAIMAGVRWFLPAPEQQVIVQFSDLSGRVQLEYCPRLPASFEATAYADDLQGGSSVIPVKVSPEVCGDSRFDDGIWIYLHRASVTVASTTRG